LVATHSEKAEKLKSGEKTEKENYIVTPVLF
jgi:hypothetical protein